MSLYFFCAATDWSMDGGKYKVTHGFLESDGPIALDSVRERILEKIAERAGVPLERLAVLAFTPIPT